MQHLTIINAAARISSSFIRRHNNYVRAGTTVIIQHGKKRECI